MAKSKKNEDLDKINFRSRAERCEYLLIEKLLLAIFNVITGKIMHREAEKAAFKVPVRGAGVSEPQSKNFFSLLLGMQSPRPR